MGSNFRPDHISFSALNLYEQCPRCYFLQYVMGCKQEDKDAWRFGTAYHAGLAAYYGGQDFWTGFDESLKKQFVLGPIVHKYRRDAKIMFDHYLIFGDKYQADKIEYEFRVPLQNPLTKETLPMPIKGFMDLITQDEAVVDHKTSSIEYGEEKRNDPQLLLYSMAYRRLFGKPPKKLIFSVHMKETKIGRWSKVEMIPDEMAEAIQFLRVKKLVNGILQGNFEAKETKGWWFTHFSLCPMHVPPRRKRI